VWEGGGVLIPHLIFYSPCRARMEGGESKKGNREAGCYAIVFTTHSQGLSNSSIAEAFLSSGCLGICIIAITLSELWLANEVAPKKSGSTEAASTAFIMLQGEDEDVWPATLGEGVC